jgi:hypothetical protein
MPDFADSNYIDPEPQRESFTSRQAFRDGIVKAVVGAAVEGRREICWVDADFADWPLDDAHLLDALSRWARQPDRKFTMIARNFDAVVRRHPRFTQWRRTYAHRVECRVAPEVSPQEMPTLMLAGDLYSLQLLDRDRWVGRWLDDEADVKAWREVVDAIVHRSEGGFPANTLGL